MNLIGKIVNHDSLGLVKVTDQRGLGFHLTVETLRGKVYEVSALNIRTLS